MYDFRAVAARGRLWCSCAGAHVPYRSIVFRHTNRVRPPSRARRPLPAQRRTDPLCGALTWAEPSPSTMPPPSAACKCLPARCHTYLLAGMAAVGAVPTAQPAGSSGSLPEAIKEGRRAVDDLTVRVSQSVGRGFRPVRIPASPTTVSLAGRAVRIPVSGHLAAAGLRHLVSSPRGRAAARAIDQRRERCHDPVPPNGSPAESRKCSPAPPSVGW